MPETSPTSLPDSGSLCLVVKGLEGMSSKPLKRGGLESIYLCGVEGDEPIYHPQTSQNCTAVPQCPVLLPVRC